MTHIPVLLDSVLSVLGVKAGGWYIDGTFGGGGYTRAILEAAPDTHVIAIDRDITAIQGGQALQKQYPDRLELHHTCFSRLDTLSPRPVEGVVLDIGVSSMQIDTPERGFSFQKDGPLDMRMGQSELTAEQIVNTYPEKQLADIIFEYGEEKASRRIAHKIVQQRQVSPFKTTLELANAIHSVMPYTGKGIDTATRTFQALRIYINDELNELRTALSAAVRVLAPMGVLAVVSFHSLEDRIVKNFMKQLVGAKTHINKYSTESKAENFWELLTPKAILPSIAQINNNPRARSAKLRALRMIL